MVNRCLSDRLTRLISKVSSNEGPWSGDPLPLSRTTSSVKTTTPPAYRTPNRPWNDDVWVATQNGGVFSHMPRERVAALCARQETRGTPLATTPLRRPRGGVSASTQAAGRSKLSTGVGLCTKV